jgi:Icc-related predicted phosphoesterase
MSKNKLRVLAAGDIHGDSKLTEKLAEKAEKEKADLVILAGDITSKIESKNLLKPFKKRNKKVLLIPGNWDSIATIDFLAELYGMKNINGYSIKHGEVGIFGAGGTPEDGKEENEIIKTLRKGNRDLDKEKVKKKIMVTHMHSKGTKSEFSGFPGSVGIRRAIEEIKPDIFIHSHIHEGEGIEEKIGKTRIINVGREGRIIEV